MTQSLKKITVSEVNIVPNPFYIGIDIHKHQITVAIYRKEETEAEFIKTELFKTDPVGLKEMWSFVQPFHPRGFVMEATGIYHHTIAQFLEQKRQQSEETYEIFIVNPADVAGIPGQQQRNDRLDAIQMVKFYAAGLIKNGRPLNPLLEDLKALFRMSLRLECDRTALKNRIIKTLDRAGFRPRVLNLNTEWVCEALLVLTNTHGTIGEFLNTCLKEESLLFQYRTYLNRSMATWLPFAEIQLSSTQRALIRQDLYELDLKSSRRTLLKLEIEKMLTSCPILCNMAHNLASLPGITKYSAVWMLAELGGINRFRNIRAYLTYCGCVPRAEISDQIIYTTHLTRHSNKFLRNILYQAAVIICNIVKVESSLKEYARHALLQKTGRTKLAYCKIMAKLARLSYGILKNQHQYSPDLGKDLHKKTNRCGNAELTVLDLREVKRAKKLLTRLKTVKGISHVSCDIDYLIVNLEEVLKKKEFEGRSE